MYFLTHEHEDEDVFNGRTYFQICPLKKTTFVNNGFQIENCFRTYIFFVYLR